MSGRNVFAVALLCATVAGLDATPAKALGGPNSSYARAYCEFYRQKATAAGRAATYDRRADEKDRERVRGTPEYWRAQYRKCLREKGR
jgi:hypothetical protein